MNNYVIQAGKAASRPLVLNKISFTLYPANSRVGRANVVLKHSDPHFPSSSGGIAC